MFFNTEIISYAKALYNYCVQYKILEEASVEINNLKQIIDNNKNFIDFLENPTIRKSKKISLFIKLFNENEKLQIKPFLINLIENDSFKLIKQIIKYFYLICAIKKGAIECYIITAAKPLKQDLTRTKKIIENHLNKIVYLQNIILPSIIGGIIICIQEKSINLSYSKQIQCALKTVSDNLTDQDLLSEIYN